MDAFRRDPVVHNALGSAAASIVSRIFTHPLDTAKARLQAPSASISMSGFAVLPYRGPVDVLTKTWKTEGLRGLYRGFGIILVGGTPGTMLYLCSYDAIKRRLTNWWETTAFNFSSSKDQGITSSNRSSSSSGDEYFMVHFFSGMLAETIACVIYVPVDVIKERLQVQQRQLAVPNLSSTGSSYHYRGSLDALIQIGRNEGVAGIYRGYFATLASFGPFSALYFVFYERTKHWARQYVHGQKELLLPLLKHEGEPPVAHMDLPFAWIIVCSASSGALASWLTSPLDMAKLRLQVQRGQAAAAIASNSPSSQPLVTSYRGVWDCLQSAYAQGGVRALFRGAGE